MAAGALLFSIRACNTRHGLFRQMALIDCGIAMRCVRRAAAWESLAAIGVFAARLRGTARFRSRWAFRDCLRANVGFSNRAWLFAMQTPGMESLQYRITL